MAPGGQFGPQAETGNLDPDGEPGGEPQVAPATAERRRRWPLVATAVGSVALIALGAYGQSRGWWAGNPVGRVGDLAGSVPTPSSGGVGTAAHTAAASAPASATASVPASEILPSAPAGVSPDAAASAAASAADHAGANAAHGIDAVLGNNTNDWDDIARNLGFNPDALDRREKYIVDAFKDYVVSHGQAGMDTTRLLPGTPLQVPAAEAQRIFDEARNIQP